VLFIAQSVVNLIRPEWTRLPLIVRVVADMVSLVIIAYLLHGSHWVALTHPESSSHETVDSINRYIGYGLWCMIAGTIAVALVDGYKVIRRQR
jgi:hypothetical protein